MESLVAMIMKVNLGKKQKTKYTHTKIYFLKVVHFLLFLWEGGYIQLSAR